VREGEAEMWLDEARIIVSAGQSLLCRQSASAASVHFGAACENGAPSNGKNHEFSADVSVWRGLVRRLTGSRFGGDMPGPEVPRDHAWYRRKGGAAT
jgi:hypothetical protein